MKNTLIAIIDNFKYSKNHKLMLGSWMAESKAGHNALVNDDGKIHSKGTLLTPPFTVIRTHDNQSKMHVPTGQPLKNLNTLFYPDMITTIEEIHQYVKYIDQFTIKQAQVAYNQLSPKGKLVVDDKESHNNFESNQLVQGRRALVKEKFNATWTDVILSYLNASIMMIVAYDGKRPIGIAVFNQSSACHFDNPADLFEALIEVYKQLTLSLDMVENQYNEQLKVGDFLQASSTSNPDAKLFYQVVKLGMNSENFDTILLVQAVTSDAKGRPIKDNFIGKPLSCIGSADFNGNVSYIVTPFEQNTPALLSRA